MEKLVEAAKAKLAMSFPKTYDPFLVKVNVDGGGTLIFIRTRLARDWNLVPEWYADILRDYCPFSDIVSEGRGIIQYREISLSTHSN